MPGVVGTSPTISVVSTTVNATLMSAMVIGQTNKINTPSRAMVYAPMLSAATNHAAVMTLATTIPAGRPKTIRTPSFAMAIVSDMSAVRRPVNLSTATTTMAGMIRDPTSTPLIVTTIAAATTNAVSTRSAAMMMLPHAPIRGQTNPTDTLSNVQAHLAAFLNAATRSAHISPALSIGMANAGKTPSCARAAGAPSGDAATRCAATIRANNLIMLSGQTRTRENAPTTIAMTTSVVRACANIGTSAPTTGFSKLIALSAMMMGAP